jgi:hypothetical protein
MRYIPLYFIGFGIFPLPIHAVEKVDFAREVLPILSDHCFQCHGPDAKARKADLRLDTSEEALRKEDPVIVPGKSHNSEVIRRVQSEDSSDIMPPPRINKKLSSKQIDTLKKWIDSGANWGKHWAFTPPTRPEIPKTKFSIRNPIDAFLFARLEKEGLKPSPEANKETLIRRITLDLTGLPPTLEEVDAFFQDPSDDAYEKVVDRLLKSPKFGERMVWEWLEAARYADTNGYQGDDERTMWPWRDWAIKAFNDNLPYDQFTIMQLAGDLLPNSTQDQKLATAFLRNHMINGEGGRIPEENRVDYVMDMTETVGTIWLGLTFNCCRCHDHKFDPIKQSEYYGLFAFFNQTSVDGGGGNPQTKPIFELISPEQQEKLAEADKKIPPLAKEVENLESKLFPRDKEKTASDSEKAKGLPKEVLEILKQTPNQRGREKLRQLEKHFKEKEPDYAKSLKVYEEALAVHERIRRTIPKVMIMEDQAKHRDSFILNKGLYNKPGNKVSAHVPAWLPPLAKNSSVNRLGLAQWLVSPEHPLTARVTVNRFWQQFFGIGLVKTTNDFGVQGERPIHPELLDWLACEFISSKWDVKQFCRLIVTSSTYRQSSKVNKEILERDPENRLLARSPRFRLPSWVIRDQALAVSGLLVDKMGGPSTRPYQPPGIWEEATFGLRPYIQDKGEGLYRRSVYTFWRRIVGPTMFFDVANRQTCSVKQIRTNTPLHALATLNDTTYVEAARVLAEKILKSGKPSDSERIETIYRIVLTRKPSESETKILLKSLDRLRKEYTSNPQAAKDLLSVGESKRGDKLDSSEHAAFTSICSLILNLDETLTKE